MTFSDNLLPNIKHLLNNFFGLWLHRFLATALLNQMYGFVNVIANKFSGDML